MVKSCLIVHKSKDFKPCFFLKCKFKFLAIFLLVLLTFDINIIAYADTLKNPDFNLTFYKDLKEIEFGYVEGEKIDWDISMQTGVMDSIAFDVFDSKGNKIHSGTSGSIRLDKNYFPIKFVARTNSNNDWRVTISIYKTSSNTAPDLSGLEEKLSGISDLLSNILDKLKQLNDYLSNTDYLQDGINNLQESTERLTNYSPVSSSVVSGLTSLGDSSGSGSGSLDFNVEIIPGHTFNLLDFSELQGNISMIRQLMVAILWIELAMFFIRIFVPRFKV